MQKQFVLKIDHIAYQLLLMCACARTQHWLLV